MAPSDVGTERARQVGRCCASPPADDGCGAQPHRGAEPELPLAGQHRSLSGWGVRARGAATTRPGRGILGATGCVAGAALVFAGTMALDGGAMVLRVLLVAAGLVLGAVGLRGVGEAAAGRRVDVAFGLALAWMVLVVGAAVLAPVLPLGQYADTAATLGVPSYLRPDLFSAHPLGTNQFGLDELSRVVWGARASLSTSALAVVVGTAVGAVVGVVAAYLAGWVDRVVGVVTNVGLAFPPLVLLIALAAALRGSQVGLAAALAVLIVPGTVRVARANALTIAQREFTLVARVLGATRAQVLRREILPNVAGPLLSLAFVTFPLLMIAEASLSFLGLGAPPPQPTWGGMIAEGVNGVFEANPHIVLVPGTVLFLTVLSLNLVGQRARKRWDPRSSIS